MTDFNWDDYEVVNETKQDSFDWNQYETVEEDKPASIFGGSQKEAEAEIGEARNQLKSLGLGVLSGATFGFDDEIQAGIESLFSDKEYSELVKEARDYRKGVSKDAPISNTIGELGGGLLTGGLVAKGLGKLGVGTAGKLIGSGTIEGGLSAAGQTEEDLLSKEGMKDVAGGAVLGAGVAGGLGLAGKGIKALSKVQGKEKLADITAKAYSLPIVNKFSGITKGESQDAFKKFLLDPEEYKKSIAAATGDMNNIETINTFKEIQKRFKGMANELYNEVDEVKKLELINDQFETAISNQKTLNLIKETLESPKGKYLSENPTFNKVIDRYQTAVDNGEGNIVRLRRELNRMVKYGGMTSGMLEEDANQIKKLVKEIGENRSPLQKDADLVYSKLANIKKNSKILFNEKKGRGTGFLNRILNGKAQDIELPYFKQMLTETQKDMKDVIQSTLKDIDKKREVFRKNIDSLPEEAQELAEKAFEKLNNVSKIGEDINKLDKIVEDVQRAKSFRDFAGRKELYSLINGLGKTGNILVGGSAVVFNPLLLLGLPIANPSIILDIASIASTMKGNTKGLIKAVGNKYPKLKDYIEDAIEISSEESNWDKVISLTSRQGADVVVGSNQGNRDLKERLKAYNEKVKKVNLDDKKDLKFKPQ